MKAWTGSAALWAINALLVGAILDVAAEIGFGPSPIKFVVIGVAAGYAVLAAVLVAAKTDLVVLAELSLAALCGLIAYSGWHFGTLAAAGGPQIAGLSTNVLAGGAIAVLLGATLLVFAFARRVPVWVRIALVCLLAYAMLPIVAALAGGAGLVEALANNAPLPANPFWVRGAFIGAAILLPGATLAALVAAALSALRKHTVTALRLAAGALALALGTQLSGLEASRTGLPALLAFGRSEEPAQADAPGSPSQSASAQFTAPAVVSNASTGAQGASQLNPLVADVVPAALQMPAATDPQTALTATLATPAPAVPPSEQSAASDIDRLAATLPKPDYDVDAAADVLGPGVAPAFALVRDRIHFESYSGLFRGYEGTFTAHAGNAVDRSVLLSYLLYRKHIPFRYVTGRLPQASAEKLFDRIFEPPVRPASSSGSPQSASPDAAAMRARIYNRARRDYAVVHAALGPSNDTSKLMTHDAIIAEIEQHMWVQAQVNGAWIDLDTAFPDSTPGKTYAPADPVTYAKIPDSMLQHVTVRVIVDSLKAGNVTSDTALEVTLPVWQVLDRQVFLAHAPAGTLTAVAGNPDALAPLLIVDGDAHSGTPVDFGGTGQSSSSLSKAVSAFNLGTPAPAGQSPGVPAFVTEWLEFETDSPDGRKDTTRRTIIDRADPAWRAAPAHDASGLATLARNKDGIIATEAVYNIWFTGGDHNMREYADAVSTLVHGAEKTTSATPPPAPNAQAQLWPLAMSDFELPMLSDHVIVPSVNDTPGVRLYADSPRIFVFGMGLDPDGKNAVFFETDLRRDVLRGVAKTPANAPAVIDHQIWFGVLEGSLEHELGATQLASSSVTTKDSSTSALLDGAGVVVVAPGWNGDSSVADKTTAARFHEALAQGDTLVVPHAVLAGGTAGWWQVTPGNGNTRAVLGPDINGWVGWSSGNAPPGGGGGTYYINPKTLNSTPLGPGGRPKSPGGGEIGEYAMTNVPPVEAAPSVLGLGLLITEIFVVIGAILKVLTM
jgi:hypothetical protein